MPVAGVLPIPEVGESGRGRAASALLSFPTLLSAYAVEPATDTTPARSWIQVALETPVKPRKLEITKAKLRTMERNWREGKFPTPPTRICVDYDHLSLEPERPGDGKAAGWFVDLELRNDDTELWALIEWTPAGAAVLASKEYQFISPVIADDWVTNDGERIGPTLLNAALTNNPQLQGMAPATLSLRSLRRVALVQLGDGDRRWRVEEALQVRYGYECYLVELFGEQAVYRRQGRTWAEPFALADDGTVTLAGTPVEVVVQYAPLTRGAPLRSIMLIKVKTITGDEVEVEATALDATEHVRALRAQIPTEGAVPAADVAALKTDLATLRSSVESLSTQLATEKVRGDAAEQTLKTTEAKAKVEALVRAGKLVPAQRAWAEALALKDPEGFEGFAQAAPRIVELDRVHGGQAPDTPSDDPNEEATRRVAELRAARTDLDAAAALAEVFAQDPALYRRYIAATAVRV